MDGKNRKIHTSYVNLVDILWLFDYMFFIGNIMRQFRQEINHAFTRNEAIMKFNRGKYHHVLQIWCYGSRNQHKAFQQKKLPNRITLWTSCRRCFSFSRLPSSSTYTIATTEKTISKKYIFVYFSFCRCCATRDDHKSNFTLSRQKLIFRFFSFSESPDSSDFCCNGMTHFY